MNDRMTIGETRTGTPHGKMNSCAACGGILSEVERIQEYMFTYILYRCQSPTCHKESLEKWCVPIRDL